MSGQRCAELRLVVPGGIDGDGLGLGEERFAALFVLVDQEGDACAGSGLRARNGADDAGIGDERRHGCRRGGGDVRAGLLRRGGQCEKQREGKQQQFAGLHERSP